MPRYIDADAIHKFVDERVSEGKDGWRNGVPYEWAYALTVIDNAPTADVAPKSEVEHLKREVRLLTENTITAKYSHCVIGSYYAVLTKSLEDYEKVIVDISSAAKAEVAREIFGEITDSIMFAYKNDIIKYTSLLYFTSKLTELKKKYTEGNYENRNN